MAGRMRSTFSCEAECFNDISDIVAASLNANIQGVVTVSSMRKGKGLRILMAQLLTEKDV